MTAPTVTEVQGTWDAGSNTNSLGATSNESSDVMAINAATVQLSVQMKSFHNATPGAGDSVDWYARYSLGDPDGASTDEHDTVGHAQFLARLDMDLEDPAILTMPLNPNVVSVQMYTENNAGEAVTCSFTLQEKRGA